MSKIGSNEWEGNLWGKTAANIVTPDRVVGHN